MSFTEHFLPGNKRKARTARNVLGIDFLRNDGNIKVKMKNIG